MQHFRCIFAAVLAFWIGLSQGSEATQKVVVMVNVERASLEMCLFIVVERIQEIGENLTELITQRRRVFFSTGRRYFATSGHTG